MKDEDTCIVKKLNPEHNCGRRFRNRFTSSNWLRKHLVDDVRSEPNVKMSIIKDQVVNKFKAHISIYQASRAKGRAKELVHGTFTKQYAQLGDYCEELLRSNPRSTVQSLPIDLNHTCNQNLRDYMYVWMIITLTMINSKIMKHRVGVGSISWLHPMLELFKYTLPTSLGKN